MSRIVSLCLLAAVAASPAHAMGKKHKSPSTPPQPYPAQPAWGPIPPGIDYSDIPAARTSDEALARFDKVKNRVIDYVATFPEGVFTNNGLGFVQIVEAKLARRMDVDYINQVLLNPQTIAYAKPGTDFHDISFCSRNGDYDFTLRGLIPILYLYGNDPTLIYPQTRKRVIDVLLTAKGNDAETSFSIGICGRHKETENHILQTEGSRYLTNQLILDDLRKQGKYDRRYDNARNGMTSWMLKHLQTFFKKDFYEFNSHPYQTYTVYAIENLAEFSYDSRVKLAAQMLLNYLDAKYAVSSNNLRRYVPFRRQPQYVGRTDLMGIDTESERFTLMAGATELFPQLPTPNLMTGTMHLSLQAALGAYRTPDLILDLIVDKSKGAYFQGFHHDAVEMYASSPSFLLSAGGNHVSVFDFFSNQMDEWAVGTTLIPTHGGGFDAGNMIRFAGASDDRKRVNTCVGPNFMCGLNPVVPDSIPQSCQEHQGNWTFFDFTSSACPLNWGFYAALHTAPCDSKVCSKVAGSYGFLEAEEPSAVGSFDAFKSHVLSANGNKSWNSGSTSNTYQLANGHSVSFLPAPKDDGKEWSIRAFDGRGLQTDLEHTPMAYGDIINADGSGLITVTNPFVHKRLTLDMRNAMHPRRNETSY